MNEKLPLNQKLLDLLWELEGILGVRSGDSLIEKYSYFVTNSEHGRDCTYAKKTEALFFKDQYSKVRSKILELNHLISKLDEELKK